MGRSWVEKVVLNGEARAMCGGLRQIEFSPGVNILAGPNGCGKSTILRVLRDRDWAGDQGCEVWREGDRNLEWVAFDGEQDNPRAKAGRGPLQFISHVGSHGEVQKRVYKFLNDRMKPGMAMLLDEPEVALDLDGLGGLLNFIKGRANTNQFLIASHHPLLWGIPGARIVELRPGYVQHSLARWRQLVGA